METTNGIDCFGDESPRNNNDNDRFLTFVDDRIFGRVDDLRIRGLENLKSRSNKEFYFL